MCVCGRSGCACRVMQGPKPLQNVCDGENECDKASKHTAEVNEAAQWTNNAVKDVGTAKRKHAERPNTVEHPNAGGCAHQGYEPGANTLYNTVQDLDKAETRPEPTRHEGGRAGSIRCESALVGHRVRVTK